MSEPLHAVFLSYASEDAEAAKRICEALRAAGIEVWFDQSELRGGDAWDRSIRQQIRDCALFVPVISQHTHERLEGYFRREWKLAVDRTHDMAEIKAFLVPVVIDRTTERDPAVPEKFRELQWTRLPDGETPAAFVERLKRLLAPVSDRATTPTGAGLPGASAAQRAAPRSSLSTWAMWGIGAIAVAAVAYFVAERFWLSKRGTPATSAAMTTAGTEPQAVAVVEKSIAVLPFVDMSAKRDQEYFAEGLSEELIDRLAHSAELKVIARTSSFAFKNRNEDVRFIGAKLGVAHVLEGSVRKAGSRLRVTAQLIRALDGVHVWSETYERDMTDIFKVQDEISTRVARALDVALNADGTTGARSEQVSASALEAYNFLLKGKYFFLRGDPGDDARAVDQYRQALKLSPRYAAAWAQLGRALAWEGYAGEMNADEAVREARDAVHQALTIDPNSADAYYARGNLLRLLVGDWAAAISDYSKAVALNPHGEAAEDSRANILLHKALVGGGFDDYINWSHRHMAADPLDAERFLDLGQLQMQAGLLDDSAASFRRLLELNPRFVTAQANYAFTLLLLGRRSEALDAAEKEDDRASKLAALSVVYWATGRRGDSDSALHMLEREFADQQTYVIASVYAFRGDADSAFAWLDRAFSRPAGWYEGLRVDPLFRTLRTDARFAAFTRKAKLY